MSKTATTSTERETDDLPYPDAETVSEVLSEAVMTGRTDGIRVANGVSGGAHGGDWSYLSLHQWMQTLKKTDGRICMRISSDPWERDWFAYWTDDGLKLRDWAGFTVEIDGMEPVDHVKEYVEADQVDIEPKLIENLPFDPADVDE